MRTKDWLQVVVWGVVGASALVFTGAMTFETKADSKEKKREIITHLLRIEQKLDRLITGSRLP